MAASATFSASSEPISARELSVEIEEWERCKNEEQYMLAADDDHEGHAMLCHCMAKIASVCIA